MSSSPPLSSVTVSAGSTRPEHASSASPPPPVVELVDELRWREEAWRAEERALANLRSAVLSAAERQARTILKTARDDIRRIVGTARCELLALLDCVQIVNASEADSGTRDAATSEAAPVTTLIEARHSVRGILGEARSGLEQLESDVRGGGLAPSVDSVVAITPQKDVDPIVQPGNPSGEVTHSLSTPFTSLMLGALIVASGAAWSFRGELRTLVHSNAAVKSSPESVLVPSRTFFPFGATLPAARPQSAMSQEVLSPLTEELDQPRATQSLGLAGRRDENSALRQVETSPALSAPSAPGFASSPGLSSSADLAPSPGVSSSAGLKNSADTDLTRTALTSAASRWLDAYYRPGTDGNAALMREISISDSRRADHRPPVGLGTVRRMLDRVEIQFTNDAAIVTGRVTEQADVGGQAREWVSWLSQVWLLERGKWRLIDMRLVGNEQLK